MYPSAAIGTISSGLLRYTLTFSFRNARLNSVVKHVVKEHNQTQDHEIKGCIQFDQSLGSNEPPKMRRGTINAKLTSSTHTSTESPGDELLFKHSETMRREKMEVIRKEHEEWAGGKDRLLELVPKYPVWVLREHPYGKMTPPSGLPSTSFQARDSVEVESQSAPTLIPNFPSAVAPSASSFSQVSAYSLDRQLFGCDGMLNAGPSYTAPFTADTLTAGFGSSWASMSNFDQDYMAMQLHSLTSSPVSPDGMLDYTNGMMDMSYPLVSASDSSPVQQYSWLSQWDEIGNT